MAKYRIEKDPSLKHGLVKYKDNGEKYYIVDIGNKMYWKNTRTDQYEHIEIVEEKYGELAEGSIVHHKDEDGLNNDEDNLEVCKSRHDHQMIHIKENALAACGNADARKCAYCGEYAELKDMIESKRRVYYHRKCASAYKKKWDLLHVEENKEKRKGYIASLSPEEKERRNAKRRANYAAKKKQGLTTKGD